MVNRVTLLALVCTLILSLAGCGGGQPAQQAEQPAAAPAEAPAPPPAAPEPVYELTKDDITSHSDWTSRNVSILGVKLGDKTNSVTKNLGDVENTRTLPEDYLTIHQRQGLFVYTFKLTGKARKFEVYEPFAGKIADPKFKKLLTSGDLKYMREAFGMEEGEPVEDAENMATEYPYDSKGFRFVKYKVGKNTINALRFMEVKKSTT
jgi:hypothetical protein